MSNARKKLDSKNIPEGNGQILPKDPLGYAFNFLDANNLKKARLVCTFWKNTANETALMKKVVAAKKLYNAVLSGNVAEVESSLKEGTNINKLYSHKPKDGILELENCNLLHILICKTDFSMDKNIAIFKLLIQHGININQPTTYDTYINIFNSMNFSILSKPEDYIIHHKETPIDFLIAHYSDKNRFRALLMLRQAEINFAENKNIPKFLEQIFAVYKVSHTITIAYAFDLHESKKGLCHQFTEEECKKIFEEQAMVSFANQGGSKLCLVM